jgi:hypothetical protein
MKIWATENCGTYLEEFDICVDPLIKLKVILKAILAKNRNLKQFML